MSFSRSIGILTLLNIAGALLSVLNVSVIAFLFGATTTVEIYFACTVLLTALMVIANAGQLTEVILPIYKKVSQDYGLEEGCKVFAVVCNWFLLLTTFLILIFISFNSELAELLVPGFEPDVRREVARGYLLVMPMLTFEILCSLIIMFLNANQDFGKAETVIVIAKAIALLIIVSFAESLGLWALFLSLWVTLIFRLCALIGLARRLGYRHYWTLKNSSIDWRVVKKQIGASYIYIVLNQIFQVVLMSGISQLPQGAYAVFSYVKQIYNKCSGVLLRPVSVVLFSKASQIAVEGGKQADLKPYVDRALGIFLVFSVPVITLIFMYGSNLLSALLGEKGFDEFQMQMGTELMMVFFVLLLFGSLNNVHRKLLISAGHASTVYLYGSLTAVFSILVVFLLVPDFSTMGVMVSLCFSTLSVFLAQAILQLTRFRHFYFYEMKKLLKWFFCALGAMYLASLLPEFSNSSFSLGGRLEEIFYLITRTIFLACCLFMLTFVFRITEVRDSAISFARFLNRSRIGR